MKKLTLTIISAIALLTFRPTQSRASATPVAVATEVVLSERSLNTLARLEEIKNMDKTNMSASEKKALRKEVRATKKQSSGGGVYISVVGLIIIILLLIILL